ncbi:hypothetical protein DQ04_09111000 [Trypanosoma grayi]|uniref:hypothetical protein n=1 Tax=Trypanosoma grayi TaxID=71804 RepID=UPI0004F4BBE9|nr:hypothetical protein DQ04_09111000 [Trypanosoma grayi]KEG07679.1 hypothetical protein DQ04_09111000 [Trypanosoma grayi]
MTGQNTIAQQDGWNSRLLSPGTSSKQPDGMVAKKTGLLAHTTSFSLTPSPSSRMGKLVITVAEKKRRHPRKYTAPHTEKNKTQESAIYTTHTPPLLFSLRQP